MNFRVQLTVDSWDITRWKVLCQKLGLNHFWVQNLKGDHSRQMFCATDYFGSFWEVLSYMDGLAQEVRRGGFSVIRMKVECSFGHCQPVEAIYNECHIKITLPENENQAMLDFCERNGMSGSWSLTHDVTGERKWYLTVRDYESDFNEARQKFMEALVKVKGKFCKNCSIEMETAVVDSNQDLDRGWA